VTYNASYTVIRARATTNIPRPISNQIDFVFNETALPSFAPIIEPMSAKIAGHQIISPRDQNIAAAPIHVKIVTHKEVAIALWMLHPMAFKKKERKSGCIFSLLYLQKAQLPPELPMSAAILFLSYSFDQHSWQTMMRPNSL